MADVLDNSIKQPSQTQQKQTTGFTNVQDVVRANRQNRLGQTVSGGVSNVVNKNQQDLSKVQQQFQQGAQQNALGTAADQAYVNQTIANPTDNQADVDRFAQLRAGQYAGPTQLGNTNQLQAQGQDLQGIANASNTASGRSGLLQRFVAPGQYTQGQQSMDNLLLGQTGGQALNQARRQANLYGQQLNQAQNAAQAQGQGLTQQAQQFGQQVTNQLGEAQTGLQSTIDARVIEQQQEAQAARDALQALFTNTAQPTTTGGDMTTMPVGGQAVHPNITQAQFDLAQKALQAGGLANTNFYGAENFITNPNSVLGQQINAPTEAQVATEQEKAKSLALSKLAGQNPTLFQSDTQVGGYNPLSFLDQANLNNAISQGQAKYNEGQTDIANAGYIKQATDLGAQARSMLESDAAKQAAYQQELNQYKLAQQNSQLGVAPPTAPFNPYSGDYGNQQRAAEQSIYDKANALLKQGNIYNTLNFQQPGDQGQWQQYNAAGMLSNFDSPYNQMLAAQKNQLTQGNQLTSQYGQIPLLERLRSLIGPSQS